MKRVRSRVTINRNRINQISQAAQAALEQTAEALHTEIVQAEVIPRMDGDLQGNKFYADYSKSAQGKVKLIHEGPYARRLYYHPEYNFHQSAWTDEQGKKHDGNPNAKGHWFEDWQKGGKYQNFVPNAFLTLLKRYGDL